MNITLNLLALSVAWPSMLYILFEEVLPYGNEWVTTAFMGVLGLLIVHSFTGVQEYRERKSESLLREEDSSSWLYLNEMKKRKRSRR